MGDYVSRQYLLDEYDRQHKGPPGGAWTIIKNAPRADVVPVVHAHWIDGYKWQTCSKCRNRGKRSWKFCPSCGAKMDGKREE